MGKAACLRQRVSGHFHARAGARSLEMLTQVRDVSWTETATALEAGLLETDEIKRLAPPYNRALTVAGRSVWFATADLDHLCEMPDERHTVGPLASPAPFEALGALRAALAGAAPVPLAVRARTVGFDPGHAPPAESFADGLVRFVALHGRLETAGAVLRVGARLWASRRETSAGDADVGAEPAAAAPEPPRRPAWDAGTVRETLEETVRRAAHAVRRGRWLLRLCECSLAWDEPGRPGRRLLVVERGGVAARADLEPGESAPVPAGAGRSPAERRAAFDLATFDRLRVLTTELRTLVADATSVEIRLGENARLSRPRLATVLRWL